ncbi:MAG: sigma 54-interacting transcriptional regulator, partial [Candidatus Adiutrix sp.]
MAGKIPGLYSINASQFLLCLFEHYHEGILITDHNGILVYYNKMMAKLDGLDHQKVLGRSITEIYQLDASQSMTLTALRLARPIINRNHIYRTVDGKLVNAISSAYPLFDNNMLVGAVCTVSNYSCLNEMHANAKTKGLRQKNLIPPTASDFIVFDDLIGEDKALLNAVNMARKAAATPSSIMLIGETGTGKELFAKATHHTSPRKDGPFMAINCAAIPSALLEAILFGTTKGAFTGAIEKEGLFELASGGTIFLDELNTMPLELQPKLLRVLQDRKVRRIGSGIETPIDIKVISA